MHSVGNFVLHRRIWFIWSWFEPTHPPVSSDSTRKAFFAKLGGLILVAGIVPKVFARIGFATAVSSSIQLRPEGRAVARQEGSL